MTWLRARLAALSEGGSEALLALLALAFCLRFFLGVSFPSVHYADEIYQVVEPAYRLHTGAGLVAWEWSAGARSWLWPGLVAGAIWPGLAIFGSGPAIYVSVVLLCTLVSLIGVAAAFGIGRRYGGAHALCAGLAFAVWHELVFYGVRPFTECVAANFLIAAVYFADRPKRVRELLAAGVFIGLSFAVRFQLAPAVAAIGVWALWRARDRAKAFWYLALGAAAPILFAGALDALTWGAPFHSYIANYQYNIVENVAALFGVSSPGQYGRDLFGVHGGLAPLIGVLALISIRTSPLPLIVALIVLASHSAIGHKEYRFIVPMIACLVVAVGLGMGEIVDWLAKSRQQRRQPLLALSAAALLMACSASAGIAQEDRTQAWRNARVLYQAFWSIHEQPTTCGLGLIGMHPFGAPGSSALPREAALYYEEDARLQYQSAYNVLIAFSEGDREIATAPEPFTQTACFRAADQTACVYRRPGACEPNSAAAMNRSNPQPRPGSEHD